MPVKNAAQFLEETLNSIITQTYHNWELIAIDDHSTDESFLSLKKFSLVDRRIKAFKNNGKGIIPALKLAFNNSSGTFISRMDADDIMTNDKLELLVKELMDKGKKHMAVGLVEYFSDYELGEGFRKYASWLNDLTNRGTNFEEVYKECVIPSPCWMMHRADFKKIGAFDSEGYPEDYDLCFRMLKGEMRIAPVRKILHHWRDHSKRASRNDPNYLDNRFLEIKWKYFQDLHFISNRPLLIWGAGKKGKELAKILINQSIEFFWITNNTNKIGKEIYGQKLISEDNLGDIKNPQIIILVANKIEQAHIRALLEEEDLTNMSEYFFWC